MSKERYRKSSALKRFNQKRAVSMKWTDERDVKRHEEPGPSGYARMKMKLLHEASEFDLQSLY